MPSFIAPVKSSEIRQPLQNPDEEESGTFSSEILKCKKKSPFVNCQKILDNSSNSEAQNAAENSTELSKAKKMHSGCQILKEIRQSVTTKKGNNSGRQVNNTNPEEITSPGNKTMKKSKENITKNVNENSKNKRAQNKGKANANANNGPNAKVKNNATKGNKSKTKKQKNDVTRVWSTAVLLTDNLKINNQEHNTSQSTSLPCTSEENHQDSQEISCSQASNFSSVFSKMILSQAPKDYSHKQRLEWLQERRQVGIWVQCNKPNCQKWRYMPHIHDPTVLPNVWYCYMNPDGRANDCNKKERKLNLREEEDCIHGQYSAGSLVWAHLQGFPWWPAIVDDDPDTEQFYWLDGFSDIPTYYHVTFFDSENVSRAWITPKNIKPFIDQEQKVNNIENDKITQALSYRMKIAMEQAKDAIDMTILERLQKFSFIARYKGPINSPKGDKIMKKRKRINKSSSESNSSDSEDSEIRVPRNKARRFISKILDTQLSNSTMVSLEDVIEMCANDKNLENVVSPTSISASSNLSAEISMQPKIKIKGSVLKNINNHIIPETDNCSSTIETTEDRLGDEADLADAVVPSTEIDVENMTEDILT